MELIDMLRRPEGKTLEFKLDLSSPQGLLRTAAAFANTAGGTIVRVGSANRQADAPLIAEMQRSQSASRSTSGRSRKRTRKRWTSEQPPSSSPPCGG